jgi:hypothetical protein
VTAALLAGCGGGGDDEDDPASGSAGGAAGVYDTTVVLLDSSCEGIVVQDAETTVEQGDGDTVELTHDGTTYTAALGQDGQFTSDAVEVVVGDQTQSLTLHGSFSGQGFRASVLATVTGGASGPCGYEVNWVGTRQR